MSNFWIATFLLVCPAASLACSLNDDYRGPTNIELIERADLVILGRVDAERTREPASPYTVGLTPIRTMKGTAPAKLTLYGTIRDREGKLVSPEPTDLNEAHSSSTWGACDRQAYAPGTLVLATFRKRPDGYIQLIYPFARNVEDVEGPDGLWVRAASLYAKIIRENPPSKRRQAFENERERLLAKPEDPDARSIANDIDQYLRKTAKK